jgi:hypothetical protein
VGRVSPSLVTDQTPTFISLPDATSEDATRWARLPFVSTIVGILFTFFPRRHKSKLDSFNNPMAGPQKLAECSWNVPDQRGGSVEKEIEFHG